MKNGLVKKRLVYIFLSVIILALLICCIRLYYENQYNSNRASTLESKNEMLEKQLKARNGVIDKTLGINLNHPLSLSENYKQIKEKYKKGSDFFIISHEMAEEITLPLYTPDGRYFGEISYSAYIAIEGDNLENYECQNDDEMRNIHSYMNYITLNPGFSLVKY